MSLHGVHYSDGKTDGRDGRQMSAGLKYCLEKKGCGRLNTMHESTTRSHTGRNQCKKETEHGMLNDQECPKKMCQHGVRSEANNWRSCKDESDDTKMKTGRQGLRWRQPGKDEEDKETQEETIARRMGHEWKDKEKMEVKTRKTRHGTRRQEGQGDEKDKNTRRTRRREGREDEMGKETRRTRRRKGQRDKKHKKTRRTKRREWHEDEKEKTTKKTRRRKDKKTRRKTRRRERQGDEKDKKTRRTTRGQRVWDNDKKNNSFLVILSSENPSSRVLFLHLTQPRLITGGLLFSGWQEFRDACIHLDEIYGKTFTIYWMKTWRIYMKRGWIAQARSYILFQSKIITNNCTIIAYIMFVLWKLSHLSEEGGYRHSHNLFGCPEVVMDTVKLYCNYIVWLSTPNSAIVSSLVYTNRRNWSSGGVELCCSQSW